MNGLDQQEASLAACVRSARHTRHSDRIHVQCEIRHMNPKHAAAGSINSRVHFIWHAMHYLATFLHLEGWDGHTPLWRTQMGLLAMIQCTHFPPQHRGRYIQFARCFIARTSLVDIPLQAESHAATSIKPSFAVVSHSGQQHLYHRQCWVIPSHISCMMWARPFPDNCCFPDAIEPGLNFHVT